MKSGGRKLWARPGQAPEHSIARQLNGKRQITAFNAIRHLRPTCSATAKSTGEQCRDIAMANGKCFRHGGATPKGAEWHRKQWPKGERPNAVAKADAKIRAHAKKAKLRESRLAQMTPEERAAHEAWHRSHRPTSPADRARARVDRQQNAAMREFLSKPPVAPKSSAEAEELEAAIKFLRAQNVERETETHPENYQGAFS